MTTPHVEDLVGGWQEDAVVTGWESLPLPVGHDAGGPVTATLVRPARVATDPAAPALLHVHGYNDYVFQDHVAAWCAEQGLAFYGLDLRRCGRSRRPDQLPHHTTDLSEYDADLDAATSAIRALGHRQVVVVGHSTGGLVASLWAAARHGAAGPDALVLNSPWLDLNGDRWNRLRTTLSLEVAGRLTPQRVVGDGSVSAYSQHLHVAHGGRWAYDLELKPPGGFPVRADWLLAVRRGQARIARGLGLGVPVLVCTAAENGPNRLDNPHLDSQETVLDVQHMWRLAPRLGEDVVVVPVQGGIHDLSLSAEPARTTYLGTVLAWLRARGVAG
ncbi:alpha/beta hydrolase [Actinotalea sp. C106]|uniref:alpha/beta hydrolase n=1 Tax=Actinotalea sp. C106 TaxID=2908644 RepID=UPI0020288A1F|nr:alpha/beta hydrolase [Actinotalea sp. C106]